MMHQTPASTATPYPGIVTNPSSYPGASSYPAATTGSTYRVTANGSSYPASASATAASGYPVAAATPGHFVATSSYPGVQNYVTTTSYGGSGPAYSGPTTPGATYVSPVQPSPSNYFAPAGASTPHGGRTYHPAGTEYVPAGTHLRGGMYTVYDNRVVPTFEAPIMFSGDVRTSPNALAGMNVAQRGQGAPSTSSGRVRLPKKSQPKRTGCCA